MKTQVIAQAASSGARVVQDKRGVRVVSAGGIGTRLTFLELRELLPQLVTWARSQDVAAGLPPGKP